MKQQIDNLIINTLLDEGEIFLPHLGTLILYRHAAERLSKRSMQRPYRELRLTKEQRGASLIDHIARVAEVSQERAEDIHAEWVSLSVRNGITTIGGVATIEQGNINTDDNFERLVNPNGRGIVALKPRTNYTLYALAGVCLLLSLGVAGWILYSNGSLPSITKIEPASAHFDGEIEIKVAIDEATEISTPAQQGNEQITATTESVVESSTPTKPLITTSGYEVRPMQNGYSYAVWGVYNQLQNAEQARALLKGKYSDIEPHIYDYGERYMVALHALPTRSECNRAIAKLKALAPAFKSVWCYTK